MRLSPSLLNMYGVVKSPAVDPALDGDYNGILVLDNTGGGLIILPPSFPDLKYLHPSCREPLPYRDAEGENVAVASGSSLSFQVASQLTALGAAMPYLHIDREISLLLTTTHRKLRDVASPAVLRSEGKHVEANHIDNSPGIKQEENDINGTRLLNTKSSSSPTGENSTVARFTPGSRQGADPHADDGVDDDSSSLQPLSVQPSSSDHRAESPSSSSSPCLDRQIYSAGPNACNNCKIRMHTL